MGSKSEAWKDWDWEATRVRLYKTQGTSKLYQETTLEALFEGLKARMEHEWLAEATQDIAMITECAHRWIAFPPDEEWQYGHKECTICDETESLE